MKSKTKHHAEIPYKSLKSRFKMEWKMFPTFHAKVRLRHQYDPKRPITEQPKHNSVSAGIRGSYGQTLFKVVLFS